MKVGSGVVTAHSLHLARSIVRREWPARQRMQRCRAESCRVSSWLQLRHASRNLLGRDLGVSRGLAKVFGILVATELVALAVVVAIVLHGDQRTEFPTSVPINSPTAVATRSSVPVSVTLKIVGATTTAVVVARGGHAQSVPPSSG